MSVDKTIEMTGAQLLCETLVRNGVDVMFGIPGGTVMPFYHAMFEYRDRLRHILCRHEQGAGHAAEGYARVTGRIGVCIGTSGPGSTNLVTAIADAWMDSTPILAITGQVMGHLIGTDAFQETDITGITLPITKHNYLVRRAEDIPAVVTEAICLALDGRTGPVHVDITKDAQQERCVADFGVIDEIRVQAKGHSQASARQCGYSIYKSLQSHATYSTNKPSSTPTSPSDLKREYADKDNNPWSSISEMLSDAEKPLIMAGNGVIMSEASGELLELAELLDIPVTTTLHGLGSFPQSHRLSLGMPGMHGWVHVNKAIQECDVLLCVGARFEDRVTGKVSTFAPNAKVIHIDIDKSELNKLVKAAIAVKCDARIALRELIKASAGRKRNKRDQWHDKIALIKREQLPRQAYMNRNRTSSLMPHDVYDGFNELFTQCDNYRVVTDVGQHQMWAAQLIHWSKPKTHITSGGAGTMGFSVPAAMGIAVAYPQDTVWVICGDGGFQMMNQELATMKQENITNVKIAIVNNGYLGMVRQWQELFEGKRYSNTPLSSPDFSMLAKAYGAVGIVVEDKTQVAGALSCALEYDGVVVIDFRVEQEANVFPMVPQGSSIGAMITGKESKVMESQYERNDETQNKVYPKESEVFHEV